MTLHGAYWFLGLQGCLDHLSKPSGVNNRQLCQHLAVDVDIGVFELADQLAVADPIDPRRRIDSGNPQTTEVPLLLTTIPVGITQGFHYLLIGHAEESGVGTPEPLRHLQYLLVPLPRHITALNSHEFPLRLLFAK
jgi:hypothetical protein